MSQPLNQSNNPQSNWLGLDVGGQRIGVARASAAVKLAEPLALVQVDGHELERIADLAVQEQAGHLVVGLPRGLDGQETAQTATVREFIDRLQSLGLTIATIDEAGTSIAAKELLATEPRPHWPHESVDSVAAMIILNDYLETL